MKQFLTPHARARSCFTAFFSLTWHCRNQWPRSAGSEAPSCRNRNVAFFVSFAQIYSFPQCRRIYRPHSTCSSDAHKKLLGEAQVTRMTINVKRCAHSVGAKSFLRGAHPIKLQLPRLHKKTLPEKAICIKIVRQNRSVDMKPKLRKRGILLRRKVKLSPENKVFEKELEKSVVESL